MRKKKKCEEGQEVRTEMENIRGGKKKMEVFGIRKSLARNDTGGKSSPVAGQGKRKENNKGKCVQLLGGVGEGC